MNLGSSAIVIRPRTTAEVVDLGCRLAVSLGAGLYLRLAAFVLLPAYAGLLVLRYVAEFDWWQVGLIAFCVSVWLEGVFTVAASRLLFRDKITARQTLRLFFRRFGSYLGALLIDAFMVGIGLSLAGFGVFATWPQGAYVTEATLLEQASAGDARTRSRRLVQGRSGGSISALISFFLIRVVFFLGFEILGQAIAGDVLQLGEPLGTLFENGGSPFAILGLLLVAPVVATTRFLHYIDTRTRADGWDIQVRFMALAAREEERDLLKMGGVTQ